MNRRPLIIIFLFFVLTTILHAQEPYTWQLTDEDGLPSMEVYDLFQDSKKYIWIGTDKGICKYNGQNFQYYKHPKEKGTSATMIQEDGLGRIWYKNFNGQLFYIDQDSIHLFEMPDSIKLNAYCKYIVEKKELWTNTHNTIGYYDIENNLWKIIPIDTEYFYKGAKGNVFCKTIEGEGYGLSSSVEGEIRPDLYKNNEAKFKLTKQEIRVAKVFYINDSTEMWIHENQFSWSISSTENRVIQFESPEVIQDVWVKSLDSIWLATAQGIYCLAKQQEEYYCYDTILNNKNISNLLLDHEGNLWISTLSKGCFVIPSLKVNYFNATNSSIEDTEATQLTKIGDTKLAIGYMSGIIALLDISEKSIKNIKPIKNKRITSFLVDTTQNKLWAYGFNTKSILSFKDKGQVFLQEEYYGPAVHTISIYDGTELLIGNSSVAFTTNLKNADLDTVDNLDFNEKWRYFPFSGLMNNEKHASIRQERTNAVWTDQKYPNGFWLGCHDSLFYYQNAVPFPVLDEEDKTIQALDILQTTDGVLWVSTLNNGVYGIEDLTAKWHYTTKNGLPSNFCNALTTDGQKLWISTNKGISYLNPKSEIIYTYDRLDGLATEEIKDLEYLDGKVWAASAKGLMSIDTNYNPINRAAPPIYITGLKINGIDTIVSNLPYELTYAQNNLVVGFEGLSYRSRGQYHYIYRLLGQDSAWIKQPAAAPFARLDQLRAGTYRFEVKGVNEDGVESKTAAWVSFKINPPFWQTWWFYGLCVLAGIGIIVGLVVWRYERIRKQQQVENELNELRAEAIESRMQALQSQMNPHFVFNAMTAIQNYWLQNKTSFALRYHAKFAKLMRFIFDYSNKEAITLKKEIEFLELYTTLEQMRFSQTIEVVWDIEEELLDGEFSIPPLLIQPIIENCFKHGFFHKEAAGELTIKFRKKDIYLHCNIIDNGVGRANVQAFQKGQKRDANRNSGLLVTKQRLAILHKDKIPCIENPILIHDLKDRDRNLGTCVELFIPFV